MIRNIKPWTGRFVVLALALAVAAAVGAGSGYAASSIGFNFINAGHSTRDGVDLSSMLGADDPFAGLYVGPVGGANYLNVDSSGTKLKDGLTMIAPATTSLGNPVIYSFGPIESDFLDPTKTHPANSNDSAFVRDMYGVAEVDNTTVPQSTTFSFSGIPYATYDLYVHALVQSPDGGRAKMTAGGTTYNMYGAGWPIDISRNIRITDVGEAGGPGEVSSGTWMVFTGLSGDTQELVFSDLTARGIIASIQFVDATPPSPPNLEITSISVVDSNAVIEWPGTNGWIYAVEYTPSLLPPAPWTNLPGFIQTQGVDGVMSATDTVTSAQNFYRVKMSQ